MPYTLTDEQQAIIDEIQKTYEDKPNVVKVEAKAGSSKSYTTTKCLQAVGGKLLYLVYSKAMQLEAKEAIPKDLNCEIKTTHGYAYQYVIGRNLRLPEHKSSTKRKLGFLNARDMKDIQEYADRYAVINLLENYFNSQYTTLDYYIDSIDRDMRPDMHIIKYTETYIDSMFSNKINMTHSGYLKYFHLLLINDAIPNMPTYDLIAVDEFQDQSGVALAITHNLNSYRFLFVGDRFQAIFSSFTSAINGFEYFRNAGITLDLSQSFRVNAELAKKIEKFGRKYMSPHFKFTGFNYEDSTVQTHMYIGRTNASIISKMIELIDSNTPFSLPRDPSRIFTLPLTLLNLKKGSKIYNQQYKFLEKDTAKFFNSSQLMNTFKTPFRYVVSKYEHDEEIQAAANLIRSKSPMVIFKAARVAQDYYNSKTTYPTSLSTAHSSKGLTVDAVTLLPCMNKAMKDALSDTTDIPEHVRYETILLYYVSGSRCRHKLYNAPYIENA